MAEQPFDELLYIPPKRQCLSNDNSHTSNIQVSYHVTQDMAMNSVKEASFNTPTTSARQTTNESYMSNSNTDAEEKLHTVIANMECVLRQSQDCLKTVQQQKEYYKSELQKSSNNINMQPQMLQKVHLLLDGLEPEQRNKAERKILQFLCECQIKTLNNEEINDVMPVNIY